MNRGIAGRMGYYMSNGRVRTDELEKGRWVSPASLL